MNGLATRDMHIGFDLDGVLLNHTDVKIELAAGFGFALTPEQTAADEIRQLMPAEERHQLQKILYHDPVHSLRSRVTDGAMELLDYLRAAKIPFTLITRRRDPVHAMHVLEHHRLRPGFFNDANTFVVSSPAEKAVKAAERGITHYIDDEREVIQALAGHVPHRYLLDVFGLGGVPESVFRLSSLDEFRLAILQ